MALVSKVGSTVASRTVRHTVLVLMPSVLHVGREEIGQI